MTEYVYRVLDEQGNDASGYNNVTGLYVRLGSAKAQVGRRLKRDQRYGWERGPYRVQRAKVAWEDVPVD